MISWCIVRNVFLEYDSLPVINHDHPLPPPTLLQPRPTRSQFRSGWPPKSGPQGRTCSCSTERQDDPSSHSRQAGLEDGDNLYVKLDELKLARERTTGPDVLDADLRAYRLKGLSAMRIFLRSRGNPDSRKEVIVSPKMVKELHWRVRGCWKKDESTGEMWREH